MSINPLKNAKEIIKSHCTFPKSCGAKIVFISDLHFPLCPPDVMEILNYVISEAPDIVIIGGDLITKIEGMDELLFFLRSLEKFNVVIVPGNHDHKACRKEKYQFRQYVEDIKSAGIYHNNYFLINESKVFKLNNGKEIQITGFDDYRENRSDDIDVAVFAIEKNMPTLFVAHNPDTLLKFEEAGLLKKYKHFPPMISGHTHAGQINVPFHLEFTLIRKDKFPKKGIYYGRHKYNGVDLYISSGLGCDLVPIRIGSRPEIVVVEI